MNVVEKIYLERDQKIESGLLQIVLREEEHKKHIKDGNFPLQPLVLNELDNLLGGQPVAQWQISNKTSINEGNKFILKTDQEKRYCLCIRKYDKEDTELYVECEDKCQWYHPKCVGFNEQKIDFQNDANIKFVCPYCKSKTRLMYQEGERKGLYCKIES